MVVKVDELPSDPPELIWRTRVPDPVSLTMLSLPVSKNESVELPPLIVALVPRVVVAVWVDEKLVASVEVSAEIPVPEYVSDWELPLPPPWVRLAPDP